MPDETFQPFASESLFLSKDFPCSCVEILKKYATVKLLRKPVPSSSAWCDRLYHTTPRNDFTPSISTGYIFPAQERLEKTSVSIGLHATKGTTPSRLRLWVPYTFSASATTCVLLIEKGIPHNSSSATSFVRVQYDGLILKKGVRVPRQDKKNQLGIAVSAVINKESIPGFSGKALVTGADEWFPGAYIPSGGMEDGALKSAVDELMRRHASFYTRYAFEVVRQRALVDSRDLIYHDYRSMITKKHLKNAAKLPSIPGTIGAYFDIFYGQKELHSRDGIPPGESLIISPTEQYNGTYGWLTFKALIRPPFVTVAQTGSIGEAFVQTEPCGVNDDCLILLPKKGKVLSDAMLFIAAAVIRLEKWRFSYGRKLTPSRIAEYRNIVYS